VDPQTYTLASEVEEKHWWFRGRRSVLRALLDRHLRGTPQARDILEVGCGNGGNLALLSRYGKLFAVELDDAARARAVQRGLATIEAGQLPGALPFAGQRFDLIAALDVLEHIEDDEASLRALRERLKPGGQVLLTVPAYPWMWGPNDRVSHHVRRYSRHEFRSLIARSGIALEYLGHFNTLLFPLAVAQVKLGPLLQAGRHAGLRIPPRPLNRLLEGLFSLERFIVPRFALPYGLSLVAVARAGRD
jgi:SAM-dependent methyltransferase